jgi:hypothetical protein
MTLEVGRSHYSEAEVEAWSRGRTPARYGEHISERQVIIAEHGSLPVGSAPWTWRRERS